MVNGDKLLLEFARKGFYFDKDTLFNFYLSMITKPFVILTGISGSGKSKIAEIFAEIVSEGEKDCYELVPVKPNWRDNKGMFGYHNVIDDSYYITPLIKLFIRALKNPDKAYFLILDEMNIAQVEHYFADYLSLIESRRVEENQKVRNFDSFHFPEDIKLSEALILSAFDLGNLNEYREVKEYRENRFTVKWKEQRFSGKDESWLPQVRTEFNQKDTQGNPSRLAGRVFEGGDGEYRLKSKSEMNSEDKKIVDRLETLFSEFSGQKYIIKQDNMTLHNCGVCIGSESGKKCDCISCQYSNEEKYMCPNILDGLNINYLVPPEMPVPLNVFTIGTVNVDETTYMFSPKVLDRSNVIEFNEIDFNNVYNLNDSMKRLIGYSRIFSDKNYYFGTTVDITENMKITMPSVSHVNQFISLYPEEYSRLLMIFTKMKKYNMQFGYRVMNEISCYVMNAVRFSENKDCVKHALDLQIIQKVLPKLHGSYEKLWTPLTKILECCLHNDAGWNEQMSLEDITDYISKILGENVKCTELTTKQVNTVFVMPKSANKIMDMLLDLDEQGFATFIR